MRETSITGSKINYSLTTPCISRGFTIVELLVVLTMIGLSLAVVVPNVSQTLDTMRLKASVRSMLATAKSARNIAQAEQREVKLTIDVGSRTYHIDKQPSLLIRPAATTLEVTAVESEHISENTSGIRFFPDGSSTGGRVDFFLAQQHHTIEIDWLTGYVKAMQ